MAPEPATDLGAADVGKLGIEDDEVGPGLESLVPGLGPREGPDHLIALSRQNALQAAGGPLLVVGDQDARKTRWAVAIARHDEACQQQGLAGIRTFAPPVETHNC